MENANKIQKNYKVETKILCRDLIVTNKRWIGAHTKAQVWEEMNELAHK